jgi:hypothetical protein
VAHIKRVRVLAQERRCALIERFRRTRFLKRGSYDD